MKKIIALCFCFGILVAQDKVNDSEQYNTLVKDMKNIKATFVSNELSIQSLNKKFDYIISKIQKDNVANSVATTEIRRLHTIIASLETKIISLENKIQDNKHTVKTKNKLSEATKLYNPEPKQVIISDSTLNKIDKIQSSSFSVQVGIFREKQSLNNAKVKFEKIIDTKSKSVIFEHCSSCKNNDLTKVLIEGFHSKLEAQQFVELNRLKNSIIIDNRG